MPRLQGSRLAVVILASCLSGHACGLVEGDRSLAAHQQAGAIRIGYAVEAPYAYVAGGGRVTGESPEVARVIAARLGIPEVHWVQTEFGALIDGLLTHRFDVIAAGMFVTEARATRVRFSIPSFRVTPGLLVARGNPLGVRAYREIVDHPNVRVAVLDGSAEEALLLESGIARDRLIAVPDALTARRMVESNQIDAFAISRPSVRYMVRLAPNKLEDAAAATAGPTPAMPWDVGAFAFRPADGALCDAWNAALEDFLGTEAHLELIGRFGFAAENLPDGLRPGRTGGMP